MISLKRIQEHKSVTQIQFESYDILYYGKELDDRTRTICKLIKGSKTGTSQLVSYDSINMNLKIGKTAVSLLKLSAFFKKTKAKRILIDSTSLDFPEMLYLLHGLSTEQAIDIDITYLEPNEYKRSSSTTSSFQLSDGIQKFTGLPLFSINNSSVKKSNLVASLGFEGHRLGQILQADDNASYEHLHALIGIPAYKPGWENRSIHKHIKYFDGIDTSILPYPASNPYEILKQLTKLYSGSNKMVIASLGTKAAVVGICVFLSNNVINNSQHKQVGAIYDFPQKSKDRSSGVGMAYLYNLSN